jgi:hypothetical protein
LRVVYQQHLGLLIAELRHANHRAATALAEDGLIRDNAGPRNMADSFDLHVARPPCCQRVWVPWTAAEASPNSPRRWRGRRSATGLFAGPGQRVGRIRNVSAASCRARRARGTARPASKSIPPALRHTASLTAVVETTASRQSATLEPGLPTFLLFCPCFFTQLSVFTTSHTDAIRAPVQNWLARLY